MAQPIIGSVEWMRQSMATVLPVYDASAKRINFNALTSRQLVNHMLTDRNGVILTNKTPTTVIIDNLVRWM